MRFAREADMARPLGDQARQLIEPETVGEPVTFFEVPATRGVPDALVVDFDHEAVKRRHDMGVSPVTDPRLVRVLLEISRGGGSVRNMTEHLRFRRDYLRRRALPRLEEWGYVARVGDDEWELAVPVEPLVRNLTAVELKLTDWRSGVSQARRYQRFANRVYLVLDARSVIPAVSRIELFRSARIGLASLSADQGQLDIETKPRRRDPLSPSEFMTMGERVWALLLDGHLHGPEFSVFGESLTSRPEAQPRLADELVLARS